MTKPVWLTGTAATALLLLVASLVWLPQYHRKFGLGDATRAQSDLTGNREIVCYPKRWDSVCFYFGREVPCFGPKDHEAMIALMRKAETLLFVKKDGAISEVIEALPAGLEFVPCAKLGCNVDVGVVKRKVPGRR